MKTLFGWAGKILRVDLTERKTFMLQTADYSDRFLGGIGIGEKLYWDESSPASAAFHPQSPLIFMTGPLAATPAPSASRPAEPNLPRGGGPGGRSRRRVHPIADGRTQKD